MKIFICCSKHFYGKVAPIKENLEKAGHTITLPNSYDCPLKEEEMQNLGGKQHNKWKSEMIKLQETKIKDIDAVLILNFDKGDMKNYIGGSTFLEIFKAWELNKKIFLYNSIPKGILTDEIMSFNPLVINQDLTRIR